MSPLKISIPEEEGAFFASKWLHLPFLVSSEELQLLFTEWKGASLFLMGTPLLQEEIEISFEIFLRAYEHILEDLKSGKNSEKSSWKRILPLAITQTRDAVYLQALEGGKYLLRMRQPVIQVQAHFFRYSPVDHSIRSMVMGEDCIFWGLQFSYPQIFQNPKTAEIQKSSILPNEKLLLALRKWLRDVTLPTPFLLPNGSKVNSPIRLGKSCFSWISQHSKLAAQQLKVLS